MKEIMEKAKLAQSHLLHCNSIHEAEVDFFVADFVFLQPVLEVCVEQRARGGSAACVWNPTTHFCTPVSASLFLCGVPALVNFSWNTHILHCRGHKQLSISSNPLFHINGGLLMQFSEPRCHFLMTNKIFLGIRRSPTGCVTSNLHRGLDSCSTRTNSASLPPVHHCCGP